MKDLSARALEALNSVDIILCEDTRRAQKLKTHFQLKPRLVSFHEHNERHRIPKIVAAMKNGKSFALISDAGTPLLSDPGFLLVREVIREGFPLTYIPGPSAIVSALVLSGLPVRPFSFLGFLPTGASARKKALEEISHVKSHTLVLFESPERIIGLIREIGEILGDREMALCREMTKMHEEILRGHSSELLARLVDQKIQGEFTIVIGPGAEEKTVMSDESIRSRFQTLMDEGLSRKEALKKLALESGRSRNDLYDLLLK